MTSLPTLKQAMIVLRRRKCALIDSDIETKEGVLTIGVGRDGIAALLMGFDLGPDEVMKEAYPLSLMAVAAMFSEEMAPTEACIGLWVDGLATGMMLGELRERARMGAPTGDEGVGQ